MSKGPLITIGILSYNRPEDLKNAILSVINQTYSNIEILVSDNGSTNKKTTEIIKEYATLDDRIQYFLHPANRGPNFNFEFLINVAKGEYFAWLADDDQFTPNFAEDCVNYFLVNPALVLSSNAPVNAITKEPIVIKYLPNTVGISILDKYILTVRHIFNDLNLFYYSLIKLEALKKCKYYNRKIFKGDTLLLLELLNYGDFFINSNAFGFCYQIHLNQTSRSVAGYKKIVSVNAPFIERRFFYTLYFFYLLKITKLCKRLNFIEKIIILRKIIYYFFKTNSYHMIKYDMGFNFIIQFFKRLIR